MRWPHDSLLALALLAACAGDGDPGGSTPGSDGSPFQDGDTLADRDCPDASFLDYGNFGAPFFFEYCTGCHSGQIPPDMRQEAPAGVDFETLDGIRARADLIYLRAADGYELMPPVGGPSADARALLGEWLACGAP